MKLSSELLDILGLDTFYYRYGSAMYPTQDWLKTKEARIGLHKSKINFNFQVVVLSLYMVQMSILIRYLRFHS
jgi:hypothetical protein